MNDEKNYRIYIDNRGNWYQDGIKITHRWTYLANNKNLQKDEDGDFYVDEGMGKIYVKVEDTPFVVRMVDKRNGDFHLLLNDETEELLEPENLYLSRENIPYTKVKNGKFKARFTRPAYYELAKHAVEEEDGFYLHFGDKRFKIRAK